MFEVTLPKRVVPQPVPFLDARQAGDCGACVLAGLLDSTVLDIYAKYLPERAGFTHHVMRNALFTAKADGLLDRVLDEPPLFPAAVRNPAWGYPSAEMSLAWFSYFCMAIDAGYYGVASVNFHAHGYPAHMDHFVLLCGVREVSKPHATIPGAARIDQEVLVSCSSTRSPDEEWVEVDLLLRTRGGYNALLARPSRR